MKTIGKNCGHNTRRGEEGDARGELVSVRSLDRRIEEGHVDLCEVMPRLHVEDEERSGRGFCKGEKHKNWSGFFPVSFSFLFFQFFLSLFCCFYSLFFVTLFFSHFHSFFLIYFFGN